MVAETRNPRLDGSYDDLFTEGFAIRDAFLAPESTRALVECADWRRARGEFEVAKIGGGRQRVERREFRGDSTCWLGEPLFEAERLLLADLERLRLDLNREGLLGLFDLDIHYARYPAGAGYGRHVDQLQGSAQRQVSLIVYLNECWTPEAGGELRLFGSNHVERSIEPVGGRMVCFLSEGREHEVLPTRRERLSITGWFHRRSA